MFKSSLQTSPQFVASSTSGIDDVSQPPARQYGTQCAQKFLDIDLGIVPAETDAKTAARKLAIHAHREQYRTRLMAAPRARRTTRYRKPQTIQVQHQCFALHAVDTETNRIWRTLCICGKNLYALEAAQSGFQQFTQAQQAQPVRRQPFAYHRCRGTEADNRGDILRARAPTLLLSATVQQRLHVHRLVGNQRAHALGPANLVCRQDRKSVV